MVVWAANESWDELIVSNLTLLCGIIYSEVTSQLGEDDSRDQTRAEPARAGEPGTEAAVW